MQNRKERKPIEEEDKEEEKRREKNKKQGEKRRDRADTDREGQIIRVILSFHRFSFCQTRQ